MTQENDIILIYFEDKPLMFARIEEILPDSKPDWYHVRLLILQMPLQVVTWILRDAYIDGIEFTMNGHKMRLEKVICPEQPHDTADIEENATKPETETVQEASSEGAQVISFKDRLKK